MIEILFGKPAISCSAVGTALLSLGLTGSSEVGLVAAAATVGLGLAVASIKGLSPMRWIPPGVPAPGLPAVLDAMPPANETLRLVSPWRRYLYRLPDGRMACIGGEDLILYCRDLAIVHESRGQPVNPVIVRAIRRIIRSIEDAKHGK